MYKTYEGKLEVIFLLDHSDEVQLEAHLLFRVLIRMNKALEKIRCSQPHTDIYCTCFRYQILSPAVQTSYKTEYVIILA